MQTKKQCRLKFKLDTEKIVISFSEWNIPIRKFFRHFSESFHNWVPCTSMHTGFKTRNKSFCIRQTHHHNNCKRYPAIRQQLTRDSHPCNLSRQLLSSWYVKFPRKCDQKQYRGRGDKNKLVLKKPRCILGYLCFAEIPGEPRLILVSFTAARAGVTQRKPGSVAWLRPERLRRRLQVDSWLTCRFLGQSNAKPKTLITLEKPRLCA